MRRAIRAFFWTSQFWLEFLLYLNPFEKWVCSNIKEKPVNWIDKSCYCRSTALIWGGPFVHFFELLIFWLEFLLYLSQFEKWVCPNIKEKPVNLIDKSCYRRSTALIWGGPFVHFFELLNFDWNFFYIWARLKSEWVQI